MKLRLTMDIELPENAIVPFDGTEYETASLYEIVADNVVQYVQSAHLQDAMKWMVKECPPGVDSTRWETNRQQIINVHKNWAEILQDTSWTVEKL